MKHLAFLPLFIFVAVSSGLTDDAKFGRTSDGRAYRVDSEGNKVIDYIADLEMNVDSLNRQVQGLEDELKEKTQVIQRMLDGRVCDTGIKERDLQKNNSRYADSNFVWSGGPVDCSKEVSAAENRIKTQCEQNEGRIRAGCEQSENQQRGEIIALQEKVNLLVLQNEKPAQQKVVPAADNRKAQDELASLNAEADRLDREIQGSTSRIEQLQDELSAKNAQYALLQTQLASLDKRATTVKASLAPASVGGAAPGGRSPTGEGMSLRSGRENFVENRQRAFESVKGTVRTDFNQAQGLIGNRDRMYQTYKTNQHSVVAFSPSPVRTSDGRDMNMLKSQLDNAASMREVSAVQSGLREIQRKMNDDIGLMQRLSRMR